MLELPTLDCLPKYYILCAFEFTLLGLFYNDSLTIDFKSPFYSSCSKLYFYLVGLKLLIIPSISQTDESGKFYLESIP